MKILLFETKYSVEYTLSRAIKKNNSTIIKISVKTPINSQNQGDIHDLLPLQTGIPLIRKKCPWEFEFHPSLDPQNKNISNYI
jgi:hypothetical protein